MSFVPILAANPLADLIAGMLLLFLGILVVAIVIFVLFLMTLSKALGRCSPRNRQMEPGLVFLNLIPLFNIVWMFFTVNRVAESLSNEFRYRRLGRGGDFGRGLGLAVCIIYIVYAVAINTEPVVGGIVGLAWLVCWIMYWVKIAGYSGELDRAGPGRRRDDFDDEYEDDDDEFERRPRGRALTRRDDDDDRPRNRGRSDDDDDDRGRRRKDEDDDDDDLERRSRDDDRPKRR